MKIYRNSAKCLTCYDEVESTHTHDFRSCSCGALIVDGGRDYLKRSFSGDWEETSLTSDDRREACAGTV